MKNSTLEILAPVLSVLRAHPELEEVRPTAFHLDGRDFIHFHDDPDGLFADVLLARGRVRMPVATPSEQADLLERIEGKLSSLAQRGREASSGKSVKRRRKSPRGREFP